MKTLRYFFGLSAMAAAVSLVSCQPQEEVNPQPELLAGSASKTWRLTDAKRGGLTSPMKSCLVGDTYIFHADGRLVFDEGTEKCNANAPQTVNGRWELKNSVITILDNSNRTYTVLNLKSLSSSRMIVEVEDNQNGNPVDEYTFAVK